MSTSPICAEMMIHLILGRSCLHSYCRCELVDAMTRVKKIPFYCSSSHSLAVTVFVPLYLQCNWDPEEGLWYRVDHSIVTPFSCFLRCSSLHYLLTSMEILVRDTLIYRHRKECLDRSLIICPFVKITILEFPLRHMAFPAMNSEWVSPCWVGFNPIKVFGQPWLPCQCMNERILPGCLSEHLQLGKTAGFLVQ